MYKHEFRFYEDLVEKNHKKIEENEKQIKKIKTEDKTQSKEEILNVYESETLHKYRKSFKEFHLVEKQLEMENKRLKTMQEDQNNVYSRNNKEIDWIEFEKKIDAKESSIKLLESKIFRCKNQLISCRD